MSTPPEHLEDNVILYSRPCDWVVGGLLYFIKVKGVAAYNDFFELSYHTEEDKENHNIKSVETTRLHDLFYLHNIDRCVYSYYVYIEKQSYRHRAFLMFFMVDNTLPKEINQKIRKIIMALFLKRSSKNDPEVMKLLTWQTWENNTEVE